MSGATILAHAAAAKSSRNVACAMFKPGCDNGGFSNACLSRGARSEAEQRFRNAKSLHDLARAIVEAFGFDFETRARDSDIYVDTKRTFQIGTWHFEIGSRDLRGISGEIARITPLEHAGVGSDRGSSPERA
jgi:hypothetical protein